MKRTTTIAVGMILLLGNSLRADAPVGTYLFPAGGQRGTNVDVLVGGLNLNKSCNFEIVGQGVSGPNIVKRTTAADFEGPMLPLPESQRQEDYPRVMAAHIKIAPDAANGNRFVRLWTSQGVTLPLTFVVGDLPEIVEKELDGSPIPVNVPAPVTINGRIYPREDIDIWTVRLKKGQTLSAAIVAAAIGSPLEARLSIVDPAGRKLAESRDALSADPKLRITAEQDGDYQVHITDARSEGGPAFVYRLSLTTAPVVDRVFPLGGRRGGKTKVQLFGSEVPKEPVDIAIPATAGATFQTRWNNAPYRLDADDLPEAFESADQTFDGSFAGNGVISKPGEIDSWNLNATKGDSFNIDLRAYKLGSPLLGVLTVRDAAGKSLVTAEAGATGDPSIRFSPTLAGKYTIEVQDRFASRGGAAFAYRLRVERAKPDFELQAPVSSLTISRGGQAPLKVLAVRKGNLNGPIFLKLDGLPPGITLAKDAIIAAGQTSVDIPLKADAAAPVASFPLRITGYAVPPLSLLSPEPPLIARTAMIRVGDEPIESLRVAVAATTPFKIASDYLSQLVPRGTQYTRKFRIERNGFTGPIEIDLADKQARHLQGVTASAITVPAGVDEFEYNVQLPSWMETGRTCRVCVQGTAIVKDADGSEHVVSYSSREQNDQIIAVIEPERLSLQVERGVVRVEPGREVEVEFKISRGQGLIGKLVVETIIPSHFHGLTAQRLELADGVKTGKLRLAFSADAKGPFNMPLVVRGVVMDANKPVTAEIKIELLEANR